MAQAKFQADAEKGGPIFRKFNPAMANYLLPLQEADGSWNEGKRGPTMDTAMAALTLMVYYRHLPTTQRRAVVEEAVEAELEEEDAVEYAL